MPAVAWWLLTLPFIAGAMLPLQAGINGQVARQLGNVMGAALLSFTVGTLALFVMHLALFDMVGTGRAVFCNVDGR